MSIRLLIIFFILAFGQLKTQTLSTVFIDTLKIIVDGKTIYESNETTLKFIPNNKDCTLIIYNDGIYKLSKEFTHFESKQLNYLSPSSSYFYINDSAYSLSSSGFFLSRE